MPVISKPMDVLENHEIRKTKKQKTAFIEAVTGYAEQLRYPCNVEKGSLGSRNIVFGNPDQADYLITAHYDTPASIGLPNFITPCNFIMFILYQILLVGVFALVAIGAGVLVGVLSGSSALAFGVAYVVYFGALVLLMIGPANRHAANDNTSGVVTVLETMASVPQHLRQRVCFVLFDLEEAGLIGSSSYRKAHKNSTKHQLVLNLDCVGDGNHILLFPSRKVKKDDSKITALRSLVSDDGEKTVSVVEKGFSYYPSDQKNFPFGVGIAALHRTKGIGYWLGRIHTCRDVVLEQENVTLLRNKLLRLINNT